jgi:hypothetical protein
VFRGVSRPVELVNFGEVAGDFGNGSGHFPIVSRPLINRHKLSGNPEFLMFWAHA